jgi:hypothetical protein
VATIEKRHFARDTVRSFVATISVAALTHSLRRDGRDFVVLFRQA